MFNLTIWRPAMVAVATVTALAAGGGAAYAAAIPSTAPASSAPGGVIFATGVHAGAAQSIRSSSPDGALTLKTTMPTRRIRPRPTGRAVTPRRRERTRRLPPPSPFPLPSLHAHRHGLVFLGRS